MRKGVPIFFLIMVAIAVCLAIYIGETKTPRIPKKENVEKISPDHIAELRKSFDAEIKKGEAVSDDPCSPTFFYYAIPSDELHDVVPVVILAGKMTNVENPESYYIKPFPDRYEIWEKLGLGTEQMIRVKYNPDSKFCDDRRSAAKPAR